MQSYLQTLSSHCRVAFGMKCSIFAVGILSHGLSQPALDSSIDCKHGRARTGLGRGLLFARLCHLFLCIDRLYIIKSCVLDLSSIVTSGGPCPCHAMPSVAMQSKKVISAPKKKISKISTQRYVFISRKSSKKASKPSVLKLRNSRRPPEQPLPVVPSL